MALGLAVGCGNAKAGGNGASSSSGTTGGTTHGATASSTGSSEAGSVGSTSSGSSEHSSGSSAGGSAGGSGGHSSSGSGAGSSGTSGASSGGGSSGAITCPPGTYNFSGDPADGCTITCSPTGCTYPDGGAVDAGVGPPFLVGHEADGGGIATYLHPTSGATLSEPMTNAAFTNFGHLKVLGDQPDAGALMRDSNFVNRTDFLGLNQ